VQAEDRLLGQHILEVLHVFESDLTGEGGTELGVPEIRLRLLVASLRHVAPSGRELQICQRHGLPFVQPAISLSIRLGLVEGGPGLGERDPVIPRVDAGE
jgi:hypothetical protein